jgi:hypothetical protein
MGFARSGLGLSCGRSATLRGLALCSCGLQGRKRFKPRALSLRLSASKFRSRGSECPAIAIEQRQWDRHAEDPRVIVVCAVSTRANLNGRRRYESFLLNRHATLGDVAARKCRLNGRRIERLDWRNRLTCRLSADLFSLRRRAPGASRWKLRSTRFKPAISDMSVASYFSYCCSIGTA